MHLGLYRNAADTPWFSTTSQHRKAQGGKEGKEDEGEAGEGDPAKKEREEAMALEAAAQKAASSDAQALLEDKGQVAQEAETSEEVRRKK